MEKDTLYGIITTIAYSIVAVLLMICVAVFVQYLRTGFTTPKVPAEGIVFSETTLLVTQDNIETASITIQPSNVLTEEQLANETEVKDMEIKLRVNNGNIVKFVEGENEVTETIAHFNTPIRLAVMMDPNDGLPVGGTCKISAYSTDGNFMAKDLVVNVDVPIQDMNVIIKDKNNKDITQAVEDEEIKFIAGDVLKFSVETIPARARQPYLTAQQKNPFFVGDIQSDRWAVLDSIGYLYVYGDDDQVTGNIALTARMLKSYGADEGNDENYVIKDFSVVTTRKTLSKIEIRNPNYDDVDNEQIDIYVGESEKIKISARATGLSDVINMNMFLKPTYYTEGDDPYYSSLTNLSLAPITENQRVSPLDLIYITRDVVDDVNNNSQTGTNIVWTICANRNLEAGETVILQFSLTSETVTRYLKISIHESLPTVGTIEGEDIEFELAKATRNDGTEYIDGTASSQLFHEKNLDNYLTYDMVTDVPLSYTKFVYFLDEETTNIKWKNGTGSQIVNISEMGQIKSGSGSSATYSQTIEAMGSGNVVMRAYLVLTNEYGQPVDCNYNIISGSAQETAGLVSRGEIEQSAPTSYTDYAGCYVYVAASAQAISVSVTEKLTTLKFTYNVPVFDEYNHIVYEDGKMKTTVANVVNNHLDMAAGPDNTLDVYIDANSMYGLLDNWQSVTVVESEGYSAIYDKNDADSMIIKTTDVETNNWSAVQLVVPITIDVSKTSEDNEGLGVGVGRISFDLTETLSFPLTIKAYNVLIERIIFDNDDFPVDANGDKYIELTGAVEDISENPETNLWAVNWYKGDELYTALPTVSYEVSQADLLRGFLHPSTPSSEPLAYLVSELELADCRQHSEVWHDPGTHNYNFETNDFAIAPILDENNRQVGKQLLIKSLNISATKKMVVSYIASDDEDSAVANYFIVNLIVPEFEFVTSTINPDVIDPNDGSFLFEKNKDNQRLYPISTDTSGLGMNRVVFNFAERQATTQLTLKITDKLSPPEGEDPSVAYLARETNINTLWYMEVSQSQQPYFTSDSTENNPQGQQGCVVHLANGKLAYANNSHGGIQIKKIYVTAKMKIFLCSNTEDVNGEIQLRSYYHEATRDITIWWGPRSDTNGYYVASN